MSSSLYLALCLTLLGVSATHSANASRPILDAGPTYPAQRFSDQRPGASAPTTDADTTRDATGLVINEIMFAPAESSAEYIEILNRSDQHVRLDDLFYADGNEDYDPVLPSSIPDTLRDTFAVAPGGYLVLVRDSAEFVAAFPGVALTDVRMIRQSHLSDRPVHDTDAGSQSGQTPEHRRIVLQPDDWEALNNGGDTVYLASGDVVIDQVTYEDDWARDDASTERVDPGGPSLRFNFQSSTRVVSSGNRGTPGARNSVYAVDDNPPRLIHAEERPRVDESEAEIQLLFSEGLDALTVTRDAFRVLLNAQDLAVQGLRLRENNQVVDLILPKSYRADRPPDTAPVVQVRGVADRTGNLLVVAEDTVALQPTASSLRINEILYDPQADAYDGWPDQTEYVEIKNTADVRVTLRGATLASLPDETGAADTLATVALRPLDTGAAIKPREMAVIYAKRGLPTPSGSSLQALQEAYPDIDTTRGAWIGISASSLRLRNEGRTIRLLSASGVEIDEVPYVPDWHAPDLMTTDGVSLERISADAPSSDASTWTSSAHPDGGTPGRTNSVWLPPDSVPQKADVRISPSPFSIERDGATRIRYKLKAPSSLRVRIYDAHGRLIHTLVSARRTGPTGELLWDGTGDDGRPARVGIYVVLFEAVDVENAEVQVAKIPVVLAREL